MGIQRMRMKIKQWKSIKSEVIVDIFLYTVNMVLLTLGYRIIAYAWKLRGSQWTGKTTGDMFGEMGAFQWEQIKNIIVMLTAIGVLITIGVFVLMYLLVMNQQYKRNRCNALESAMGYPMEKICWGNIMEEEIKAVIAFVVSVGISCYVWSWFEKIDYVSMLNSFWENNNSNEVGVYVIVAALFFGMVAIYTRLVTEFAMIDDEANLLREE